MQEQNNKPIKQKKESRNYLCVCISHLIADKGITAVRKRWSLQHIFLGPIGYLSGKYES